MVDTDVRTLDKISIVQQEEFFLSVRLVRVKRMETAANGLQARLETDIHCKKKPPELEKSIEVSHCGSSYLTSVIIQNYFRHPPLACLSGDIEMLLPTPATTCFPSGEQNNCSRY